MFRHRRLPPPMSPAGTGPLPRSGRLYPAPSALGALTTRASAPATCVPRGYFFSSILRYSAALAGLSVASYSRISRSTASLSRCVCTMYGM